MIAPQAQASPETEFWAWFQKNEAALYDFERDPEPTFDRLAAAMHKVHPRLTFEFGPKEDCGRRDFVISADGIVDAFPKVESLYSAAPRLSKWKVIKFRPRREPYELRYHGLSVPVEAVTVLMAPEGAKAGMILLIDGYSAKSHDSFTAIAFLFLDQALGEYDVETRVGSIQVRARPKDVRNGISLAALPQVFDALFASQKER